MVFFPTIVPSPSPPSYFPASQLKGEKKEEENHAAPLPNQEFWPWPSVSHSRWLPPHYFFFVRPCLNLNIKRLDPTDAFFAGKSCEMCKTHPGYLRNAPFTRRQQKKPTEFLLHFEGSVNKESCTESRKGIVRRMAKEAFFRLSPFCPDAAACNIEKLSQAQAVSHSPNPMINRGRSLTLTSPSPPSSDECWLHTLCSGKKDKGKQPFGIIFTRSCAHF